MNNPTPRHDNFNSEVEYTVIPTPSATFDSATPFTEGAYKEYTSDDNDEISLRRQDRLARERERARRNRLLAKQRKEAVLCRANMMERHHDKLLSENDELKCHVERLNEEVRMLKSTQVSRLQKIEKLNDLSSSRRLT